MIGYSTTKNRHQSAPVLYGLGFSEAYSYKWRFLPFEGAVRHANHGINNPKLVPQTPRKIRRRTNDDDHAVSR